MEGITRDSVQVGEFKHEHLHVGDADLKISIDSSQVDDFIGRLDRAVAAFKAEWSKP